MDLFRPKEDHGPVVRRAQDASAVLHWSWIMDLPFTTKFLFETKMCMFIMCLGVSHGKIIDDQYFLETLALWHHCGMAQRAVAQRGAPGSASSD